MKKKITLLFLLLFILNTSLIAQRKLIGNNGYSNINNDTLNTGSTKVILSGKTVYTDYKIFSHKRDTTYIDTTLTIQKEYIFNYLRKDNFELLAFHNQGQTFNNLGYDFSNLNHFPDIGFRAKQFSYIEIEDIKYYEVPTPTTEITYKTGMQQGQVLDAIFTLNFSRRFNVSMSYKGLRSLGSYRRSLVSSGNFRTTFQYRTQENQYEIRGHIASQDFFHQENGGLTANALQNFINEDPNFQQRERLDVNLNDAESQFDGSRVYVEQSYKLLSSKDTITNKDFSNLKIGHVFTNETKRFSFTQPDVNSTVFGERSPTKALSNEVSSKITDNEFNIEFNSKYVLGKVKAKLFLTSYSYGYDTILNTSNSVNNFKFDGNALSFGADWNAKIKNISLFADARTTPGNSKISGNYLKGVANFKKDSLFTLGGSILLSSKSPNFNTILHQSIFDSFNWENNFSNIVTRDIGFAINSKWGNANFNFTNIDNYTYFNENNTPEQFDKQITYLKLKVNREFKYQKLALDNTVMYQNVSSGSSVFRVPELVTRNTLYYTDYWFKGKPMLVNIGATFKYFTKYNMNAYNPLVAEFTLQNTEEIGFSTVDIFFNAQVRRTRIYFKIDNVTSGFSSKNYFSAPNYPYRDFTIRFGLVWNWFI